MKNYQIQTMSEKHLPMLAEIERVCFHAPWSEQALRDELGKGIFLVAQDKNESVLGYVGCQTVLDEGYITNVAVAPCARRQGVARNLLDALAAQAKKCTLSFVTLEVRRSNAPAIALYEQAGYCVVGTRPHFYRQPTEDAILMTRYFTK